MQKNPTQLLETAAKPRKAVALLACLAGLVSANAGTFTNNFDNGLPPSGIVVYGSADPGAGDPNYDFTTGGFGGAGGALKITADVASQQSTAVLDDLDPGQAIGGFEMWFKLSLYSVASAARPADGISISFAPTTDAAVSGTTVGEDGTGTGVVVSLDVYDNINEAPAMEIRYNGQVLVSQKFDGPLDAGSGPDWVNTPPLKDSNGNPVNPWTDATSCPTCQNNWADFHIVFKNSLISVTYKGVDVFKNVFVPWAPYDGQFVIGSRTGGAFENTAVDNLGIVTTAAPTTPTITKVDYNPFGLALQITDNLTQVNQSSIQLTLDNAAVTPTITKNGSVTTVRYTGPNPLAIGSSHTANLVFSDNGSPVAQSSVQLPFVVASYATLTPALAVTGVDTSKPGFKVRPYQVTEVNPNTVAWTEEMFAGLHGANVADLTQLVNGQAIGTDGFYTYTDVVNWDQVGLTDGNFNGNNGYQDISLPGQPNLDGIYDNDGEEVLTFISFPSAGAYSMAVNSDDGFKVTTGANPRDQVSSILVGQFNGGRGSSDTVFPLVVQQPGVYPFRLLWENGGGGANCEWFTIQPDGTKVLINDPDATNTTGIKAYYSGPALPAYISRPIQSTVTNVTIYLTDSATPVNTSSVGLKINGTAVTPTTTKANGVNTIVYAPTATFASGATNTLTLTYTDSAARTVDTTFITPAYTTLNASWAVTGVDTSKPGFKVRPYQVTNASPNTIEWTEEMLKGLHGSNIADLTQTIDGQPIDTNGYYTVTGVVNWDKDGGADGNFSSATGFDDVVLPGQPSADGTATYNNDAEEVLTFLQFPAAGFYSMGVNSDDGFRVTSGPNPAVYPPAAVLGEFNAGRGATDTLFTFYVPAAGFYPFRLLWENGGSGANCEWFSVLADGTKVLVNDPSNASAIKAYYSGPAPSGGGTGATLSISASGGNVTIQWTGGGTLQSATAVTGPWTDVTGKTSPATVPVTGAAGFYRVSQ